jgi:predicted RNA-binding Zn-ribbon protein involved in translation (DUF1610 family)
MKKKNSNRYPSLISVSNGKPEVIVAKKKIKCTKCSIEIASGNKYFSMTVSQSGFSNKKRYCLNCGLEIIKNTESKLEEVKSQINS